MIRGVVILFSLICLFSCRENWQEESSVDDIRQGFESVPDSIHTTVFWYWITDHISKNGVTADLHSMAEAGINRAFIGFIGLPPNEMPIAGSVRTFSDEWWDILHTALKTAAELNIEIGLFNCPGWSQSGGPWIKQNQTMRYLKSIRHDVVGGTMVSVDMGAVDSLWQDVKVIAYPTQQGKIIDQSNATLRISGGGSDRQINNLFDNDPNTSITFAGDKQVCIDIKCDENLLLKSFTMVPTHSLNDSRITLQYKNSAGNYVAISEFKVNRIKAALSVGFDPYAPIVVSTEPVIASEFKVLIDDATPDSGFSEIKLSSVPVVDRFHEKTFAKMHQSMQYDFWDYMWPAAPKAASGNDNYITPDRVLDITRYVENDKLTWNAPKGNWTIARLGTLPTGVVNDPAMPWDTGYEVDKMSKEYVEYHFDQFIGEILERIPLEDRRTWKVVIVDSFEKGGQNFTDDFIATFQDKFGYDPTPFFPVYDGVVVGNNDISDRFLWDMRRMVADRLAYSYAGTMREKAHQNGLTMWMENYGTWGFPGEFLQYGGQTDEISGEFWSEGVFGDIGNVEVRSAASAAHIYGKKKISAESFTSAGQAFSRYPAMIKMRGDRFFTEGVNNTLLHVFISQDEVDGKPGLNAPFGTEFDRKNTLFSHLDLFVSYLKRVNFMLQQGVSVADVAYYIGEDVPKMVGEQNPALPRGYQFDYINAEVLLERATVKNGLLTLPDNVQYKILVLPQLTTMRPAVLKRIQQLVNDGLVVLGPKPTNSPSYQGYPEADRQVRMMADQLWEGIDPGTQASHMYGKGRIMSGMDLTQALKEIDCKPDFECTNVDLKYCHRSHENMEIYFVSNQSDNNVNCTTSFRVATDMKAELWNPVNGQTRELKTMWMDQRGTSMPMELYPSESVFVVFYKDSSLTNPSEQKIGSNFPRANNTITITEPWTLEFEHDIVKRGPQQTITMSELTDLSQSINEKIKYYAGKIIYRTTVNIDSTLGDADSKRYLDLGMVYNMAKVKINGQYVGGVWTEPYRVLIDPHLKLGDNLIEVEVVNTWVNRIIGDMKLPEAERKVIPINNPWSAEASLHCAGLRGPVTIQVYNF